MKNKISRKWIWILSFVIIVIIGFSVYYIMVPQCITCGGDIWITISIVDLECKDGKIKITLRNEGTVDISNSQFFIDIDGDNKSDKFTFSFDIIHPGDTGVATSLDTYEMNRVHEIRVISSSRAVDEMVKC